MLTVYKRQHKGRDHKQTYVGLPWATRPTRLINTSCWPVLC